ncbi:MAG TPA: hemolysin family protein [Candidatus Limnocylindrales bacterium]|jgi:putative hemolysin|nr:hemolysin family protein [Candidatus Limnocylindrales bacterium]
MPDLGLVLIIAFLIFLEALFVAAEIALVTVRRTRIEQLIDEGNRRARVAQALLSHPGRFLAVIQIGITFVTLLASAYAAERQVKGLADTLATMPILAPYASTIALIVITAIVSLATILFGELLPKTLALAYPERFALIAARPVDLLGRVLGPLVWFLTRLNTAILRIFGVREVNPSPVSTEELRILIERGTEQGILEAEEEQMISAVIELSERRAHEVMVPRVDIVAVPVDVSLAELVDTFVQQGHSRIPVYEGSIDQVVGVLYAKDLLPYLKGPDEPPDIRSLMRTPVYVPESISVDDLLHELQRRKVHLAIVFDEYGGTAGLVTIEDLIEEIVGEIEDEYDVAEEPLVERISEDEARVDGRVSVDDLAELFELHLNGEDQEEYDTVGGMVYHYIGGVPKAGDTVELDGLVLTVESTDGRRVGKVLAVRRRTAEEEVAEEESQA